jgi:hypothetical protein
MADNLYPRGVTGNVGESRVSRQSPVESLVAKCQPSIARREYESPEWIWDLAHSDWRLLTA